MPDCFYLLLVLHVTEGCTLTNNEELLHFTAPTGGSVLLPCSCAELRAKPETLTWKKYNQNSKKWDSMPIKSDQYTNRVQLVNGHSPGNLSLLISHLTEEDGGDYMCDAMKSGLTYIKFTVKGCTLTNYQKTLEITAHTGGSVLLPCSCTELHLKPETFTWKKNINNIYQRIHIKSDQYRNRVQLVNDDYPGNLSLLISHLTEEGGGDYRCDAMKSGSTNIRLTVGEPPQSLPFIPFALVTVIFLHIIVAVVYHTKKNKDTNYTIKQL
ncbi:junctional adhesion molecule-like [Colossoma macropomum]|uniref:junctional adhesion molecule-like n=1 Tax=Colossoma macropomum TaxID=42526 RepID=UPI0018647EB7|nr:junctional adhesion molecule-like [Colossoma macropomum]